MVCDGLALRTPLATVLGRVARLHVHAGKVNLTTAKPARVVVAGTRAVLAAE